MLHKKSNLKKSLIGSICIALSLCTMANAAEVFKYKFQSSDNAGSENFKAQQAWSENVNTETLDAISTGIIDGHVTAVGYFSGKDPAFGLLGNTVGAWSDVNELLLFMEHGGGNELLSELLAPYGVTNLGSSTTGLEAFVSKVPLNGVKDLKGLKLRAPEGLVQAVFAAAKASPVNLPGSEVFTSLDKGVIQAADYTVLSTNDQQGLHKIAKHPVYPGFHSLPLINVSLNTKKYNKLPENLKEILKTSVIAFSRDIVSKLKLKDLEVLGKLKQDSSITIHDWSSTERNKFRAIAQQEWKKFAKKSPNAKKVYEVLSAYLSKNGML